MDGGFGEGSWTIKASQMTILNSIFILSFMPIFESFVYPCFSKCNLLTSLQRIATGGICASLAFAISGIIELQLEVNYRLFKYHL